MIHLPFERTGPEGGAIRGDVRMPDGPRPRAAVVVVHGFKGFKDWGFLPFLCEELASAGFAVVSFNFSLNGIGDRPDTFTELEAFGRNTLTRELSELLWVIDAVMRGDLLSWRPDRLGLVGHSRGGAQAVLATREDPRVGALVTWAAVSRLDRWSEETRAEWRERGRMYVLNTRTGQQMPVDVTLLDDFEAHRARLDVAGAAQLLGVPWLVVHGAEDLTVPASEGERLVALGPRARFHRVSGADHTFGARHPFQEVSPHLSEALSVTREHLARHIGGR